MVHQQNSVLQLRLIHQYLDQTSRVIDSPCEPQVLTICLHLSSIKLRWLLLTHHVGVGAPHATGTKHLPVLMNGKELAGSG